MATALENSTKIYSEFTPISPSTNRPINDNEPESPLPGYFCVVCEVKIESAMTAIQHFKSKAHLKAQSQSSQSPLKRKYDSVSNHTYNNTPSQAKQLKTDEVNKSQQNEIDELTCKICDNVFNSKISAEQHFKGRKHLMAAANAGLKNENTSTFSKVPVASATTNVKGKSLAKYHCTFCDIALNSDEQMTQHCNGIRHKIKSGEIKEPPAWWVEQQSKFDSTSTKRSSGKGLSDPFKCEVCNIFLNSEVQLSQHLSSAKHKDRVEDKKRNKTVGDRGRGRGAGRGRGSTMTRGASRGGNTNRGGTRGGNHGGNRGGRGTGRGSGGNDRRSSGGGRMNGSNSYTKPGGQCRDPIPDFNSTNFMPLTNSRIPSYGSTTRRYNAPPLYSDTFVTDAGYDQFYT